MRKVFFVFMVSFMFYVVLDNLNAGIITGNANLVLGQQDFVSNVSTTTQSGIKEVYDIAIDTTIGRVYVCDTSNHRILFWNNINSLTDGKPADGILGQFDYGKNQPNDVDGDGVSDVTCSSQTFNNPGGICVDGSGNLWVADSGNNRVLRFPSPVISNMSSDLVLGQADFISGSANRGGGIPSDNTLYNPADVYVDKSGNVWVADTFNNRVLRYSVPISSGMSADLVLGQADFASGDANRGGSVQANTLANPYTVRVDDSGSVWVADSSNNRVLRYSVSLSSGMDADLVLGQSNFTSNTSATTQTGLRKPVYVIVDDTGNIYVSDNNNHRVLRYSIPISSGMSADLVLGQADFISGDANRGNTTPAANTFNSPYGIELDNLKNIWIADYNNNRVLKFNSFKIISINPNSLDSNTSVNAVISGTEFLSGTIVKLTRAGQTDIPATNVVVVDETKIECTFDLTQKATGYWSVVLTKGIETVTLTDGFLFNPMTVTGISPSSGYNAGTISEVEVFGTNFTPNGSFVWLAKQGETSIQATNNSVITSTSMRCTIDLTDKATGQWNVVVTSGSIISKVLENGFEIKLMNITDVSPAEAGNTSPVDIVISGNGLQDGSQAKLQLVKDTTTEIQATKVIYSTTTPDLTCTFNLTGKTTGYWNLIITTAPADTKASYILNKSSAVLVSPMRINSITPASAANNAVIEITEIAGLGFVDGCEVKLLKSTWTETEPQPEIVASSITVVNTNKITCFFDLTDSATGYWDVVVSTVVPEISTSTPQVAILKEGFKVNIMNISSVTPDKGANTGPINMEILGEGFLAGNTVKLIYTSTISPNEITATNVVTISTMITCTFDLKDADTGYWNIEVTSGGVKAKLESGFSVVPMTINSILPDRGAKTGSVQITELSGLGFLNGAVVEIQHVTSTATKIIATDVVVISTKITCTFDLTNKPEGYYDVIVTTDKYTATLSSGFSVVPMSITSITPASGINTGKVDITELAGEGFVNGCVVKLVKAGSSDIVATGIVVETSTKILCSFDLKDKTTGQWDVVISTLIGTSTHTATLAGGFTVEPMTVTAVNPSGSMNVIASQIIKVEGNGFISGCTVKFTKQGAADINATGITVESSTSIVCTVNLFGAATGFWNVVVTTGSISATLNNCLFVAPMTVASITPDSAVNTGQVNITEIAGFGFLPGCIVRLEKQGKTPITAINVNVLITSTKITCTFDITDAEPGKWDVVVTTGSVTARLVDGFTILPPYSGSQVVNPASSTTIDVVTPGYNMKVEIPAGTFSQVVTVTVSTTVPPVIVREGIKITPVGVEITNSGNLQPLKEIILTITYLDSDVAGFDEDKLVIGRWDESRSAWIPLETTRYPDQNKVVAKITHLSKFAILQLTASGDLENIIAYPQPFTPGLHVNGLTIGNLTESATIKIYTISGEPVADVPYNDGTGRAVWDGKNKSGKTVSSGVYIVLVKNSSGKKIIKIAVEK